MTNNDVHAATSSVPANKPRTFFSEWKFKAKNLKSPNPSSVNRSVSTPVKNVPMEWYEYTAHANGVIVNRFVPVKVPLGGPGTREQYRECPNGARCRSLPNLNCNHRHDSLSELELSGLDGCMRRKVEWFSMEKLKQKLETEHKTRVVAVVNLAGAQHYAPEINTSESTIYGMNYAWIKGLTKIDANERDMKAVDDVVARFTAFVDAQPLEGCIMVHCTHGCNRTGLILCCYLIEKYGMTPHEAIDLFEHTRGEQIKRFYKAILLTRYGSALNNDMFHQLQQQNIKGLSFLLEYFGKHETLRGQKQEERSLEASLSELSL